MSEVRRMQPVFHDIAAEQQVLGIILLNNDALDLVSDILQPEHFHEPLHGRIYDIARQRIANGHLVSPVTLKVVLSGDRALADLGGPGYLARMAGAAISAAAVREYAATILDLYCRRTLHESLQEARSALEAGVDTPVVRAGVLSALQGLPEGAGEKATHSFLSAATEAVVAVNAAWQGERSFLKTGIEALDAVIGGLGPTDYMVLGGATSMGKTSTALEIASNVGIRQRRGVAIVSLEMHRTEVANRVLSAASRVPYEKLRATDALEESEMRRYVETAKTTGETANIRIIPKHVRDLAAIHAAVRQAKRELGDLALIVVDYAQLVRGPGKDRYQQMTEVSIGLKALAGLMEAPVLALVQLSRELGGRDIKRPRMTDIKETGQYENDADTVVLCHWEHYWLSREGPKTSKSGDITAEARADWEAEMSRTRNVMELIVAKNRHGKIATVEVGFHAPTNRFWRLGDE
jgi:replicative DNA helicase